MLVEPPPFASQTGYYNYFKNDCFLSYCVLDAVNGISLHPKNPLLAISTGQRTFTIDGSDDSDSDNEITTSILSSINFLWVFDLFFILCVDGKANLNIVSLWQFKTAVSTLPLSGQPDQQA